MEHTIYLPPNKLHSDNYFIQKMNFINNALEDGWTIKKNKDKYVLTKNHEGKSAFWLAVDSDDFKENSPRYLIAKKLLEKLNAIRKAKK